MERELSEQNVAIGASSQDNSEIIMSSVLRETESSTSQNSGAILKTVAKTKSGGVKLGSFRVGGRKKTISEEDPVKKKSKKNKKEKSCDDSDKQDSEDSAVSTPSPGNKQTIPSKASSLVRKLSIGKYKASGSRKSLKSPDTPSSQEEYQSVSTEEECFVSQSSSLAATNGHPSLEDSTTPGQYAASTVGNKSDSSITDPFTPTTSGITDPLSVLEPTSQHEMDKIFNAEEGSMIVGEAILPTATTNSDSDNMAAPGTFAYEWAKFEAAMIANRGGDMLLPAESSDSVAFTPVCTTPPLSVEDRTPKHDVWERYPNRVATLEESLLWEDMWSHCKNRHTFLRSLLTEEQKKDMDEYEKRLTEKCMEEVKSVSLVPDLYDGYGMQPEYDQEMPTTMLHRVRMPKQEKVNEKREHLYKILVIGELGTGKTSIIKRYVHQFFSQHYRATIGVDFALKVLNWDANTIVRLQLWDIAGQERFGNMTRVYYKEAVGAFIVFDVTRAATFDAVVKWKQDLDAKVQLSDGSPIPCVLLANKCDQQKEGLVNNPSKMDEYCKERDFAAWFETSAKENVNIEDAANCLISKILQNNRMLNNSESSNDLERFTLDGRNQKAQKSKTCSC